MFIPADPPAGDVGSNAQEAACLPPAAPQTSSNPGNGYAYSQAIIVVGSIPPAAAGLKVRGKLVLPAGVLSAECMDLQEVGYMTRVPASLKVGAHVAGYSSWASRLCQVATVACGREHSDQHSVCYRHPTGVHSCIALAAIRPSALYAADDTSKGWSYCPAQPATS